MVLVTEAIRNDLATQPQAFARLRQAAREELSDVRLLDILALRSQGNIPGDKGETGQESSDEIDNNPWS
jgi:hypothetical protein